MLSSLGGIGALGSNAPVAQLGVDLALFGLSAAVLTALWSLLSSFLALFMLGLFPGWTEPAVKTARRGPVMSGVVGILGSIGILVVALVIRFLLGVPLIGLIVGFAVAVPLFFFGLASYAVSVVSFGAAVSRRLGKDSLWLGVFVGAATLAVLSFVPVVGPFVTFFVQVVGLGASIRVTFGSGASEQGERSVPSERFV